MKSSHAVKVVTNKKLARITTVLRQQGKKIVLCHGVFDLIHPGHIRLFHYAKKHGDVLVVSIPSDAYVKKGPGRPVFKQELRAEVLASIEAIDFITIVHSEDASVIIKSINPHAYVIGAEFSTQPNQSGLSLVSSAEAEALQKIQSEVVLSDSVIFSSSQLLNEHFQTYPVHTQRFLQSFKRSFQYQDIQTFIAKAHSIRALVIGDAIIDQYVYSDPIGKSTKEPIVVHKYLSDESFAGGALATANHLSAIVKDISLLTAIGKEQSYESFIKKHIKPNIHQQLYVRNGKTIVKRRYIDEQTKQKLFQISTITDEFIPERTENNIMTYLQKNIASFDMVIVNDFGHGLLTKKIIHYLSEHARYIALNVQANSANYGFNIVTKYPRADFVCIDEMELRLATHDKYSDVNTLIKEVYKKLACTDMIVTKGRHGSVYYSKNKGFLEVPTLTNKILDRVGAGDALFSIASPFMYMHMDPLAVTFIGNAAAALKIQTIGNKKSIDMQELDAFLVRLLK